MSNEFLKGIQARERVVILQELRTYDNKLISYYRDSVIPVKDQKITLLQTEYINTHLENARLKKDNKRFRWLSIFLAIGLAYKW